MSTATTALQKPALELKSTSLSVPVLMLINNNIAHIEHQLKEKISQAPEFFKNSPLLVDLQELNAHDLPIDTQLIIQVLRNHNFLPIGIRGGTDSQNQDAIKLHVPVHSKHHSQSGTDKPKQSSKTATSEHNQKKVDKNAQQIENKLITQPIRSGQRVYANGDLIVTATVSAGAEIMAEGNIHVYGSLRGRALAGVQGNTESCIFCSDLQAELVSIAGNYQISDEINESVRNQPVQIYLQEQALIIKQI